MLISKTSTNTLITALASSYPTQIPISFTSSQHFVHYLDLCISLNYYTILHHKVHHQVFQKPHHKYMFPHFSSNHPQHVFTGIIKTETFRYSRLSTTKNDYDFVQQLFFFRLTNLDYPCHETLYRQLLPLVTITNSQRTKKTGFAKSRPAAQRPAAHGPPWPSGPAARRPGGPAARRPGGPVAHFSFSTVFLSSGKSTRMHRSASGLGVQNGRR